MKGYIRSAHKWKRVLVGEQSVTNEISQLVTRDNWRHERERDV